MKRDRTPRLLVCLVLFTVLNFSSGAILPTDGTAQNVVSHLGDTASERGVTGQATQGATRPAILYLSNVTTLESRAKQVAELANRSLVQSVTSYLSGFDNRYTGTQGSLDAITYMHNFLGVNCSVDELYLDNFTFDDGGAQIHASNIVARVDATNQSSKTLLVTAHYDSIGCQYPFNVYSVGARGADDDASGVAAVLEIARILSLIKDSLGHNVLFIIFAAEEGNRTAQQSYMQQGSRHWISTSHMGIDSLQDIIGVINLDAIAYKYGGPIGIYHHNSGDSLAANISSAASMLAVSAQDEEHARSDPFLKLVRCRTEDILDGAGIPAVTLSTHYSNPFIHTQQDTVSELDFGEAINFTKTVLLYAYLTAGEASKREETFAADWIPILSREGQYVVNETNYIDTLIRPCITEGYKIVILDPSLGEISRDRLLSITSACVGNGKPLPILALGIVGVDLLQALEASRLTYVERYSSGSDVVAYVDGSPTGLSHHQVFNFPNIIALKYENATCRSYKVVMGSPEVGNGCCQYLVRNTVEANTPFLGLGSIPYAQEEWGWIGVLHSHSIGCGPIGFIGVNGAAALAAEARDVAENMVDWLLNGARATIIAGPAGDDPLVGDQVKIKVALRDSLTWSAISSTTICLTVLSPDGGLLLREMGETDQDGAAESSSISLTRIGVYEVKVDTFAGGSAGATETFASFKASPRVSVQCLDHFYIVQGESANVQLNISFKPAIPEDVILELAGRPLLSSLSIGTTLSHGYTNLNMTIPTREATPAGEHVLTITVMPVTRSYIAGERLIRMLVSPGYDIMIVEVPYTMTQGATSELVLKLTSHRTIQVNGTLKIESTRIEVKGQTSFSISAGETQEITLQVEEASTSPYCWGQGEMRVSLVRDNSVVLESRSVSVFVSVNPTSLLLGYVLPPTVLLVILAERLKRSNAKWASIGTLLGGSAFFAFGLAVSQSMFLIVPLAMMTLGSYSGTAAVRYIFDKPLPKGYNWYIPLDLTKDPKLDGDEETA